jgi:hypothetical protein
MRHRALDPIQNLVEVFAEVGGEETEDEVAVFLEEGVFPAVAAIGCRVVEVLVSIEFEDESEIDAEEIDLHDAAIVEGDGEVLVEAELVFGGGEGLEAFEEKFLAGAAGFSGSLSDVGRVDEELGKRLINTVTDEPPDAGGVVLFPLWIKWEGNLDRPTGQGAGGEEDGVADCFVSCATAVEHAREHGDVEVGVVVNLHHSLAVVEAVKSSGVLRDGAAPGDGHGEEESVESGIVEAFADKLSGGKDDARFVLGDGRELLHSGAEGFLSEAPFEGDEVLNFFLQQGGQELKVFGSLGEDEGCATGP